MYRGTIEKITGYYKDGTPIVKLVEKTDWTEHIDVTTLEEAVLKEFWLGNIDEYVMERLCEWLDYNMDRVEEHRHLLFKFECIEDNLINTPEEKVQKIYKIAEEISLNLFDYESLKEYVEKAEEILGA